MMTIKVTVNANGRNELTASGSNLHEQFIWKTASQSRRSSKILISVNVDVGQETGASFSLWGRT